MKIVRINELHKYIGCKVAKNVYIGEDQLYIGAGSELNKKSVRILQEKEDLLPFEYIYIHTSDSEGIEILADVISDQLKFKAKKKITEVFNNINVANSKNFNETINTIIDDLINNQNIIQGINTLLINKKSDVAAHCLNTSILAAIISVKMGFPRSTIESITIGAALHDVGKAKLDSSLLISQNPHDILKVQEHPIIGYHTVDKSTLTLISKRIILMHHVWQDFTASKDPMTGIYNSYPKMLNKNLIDSRFKDIYISIVQVCDVFDMMCSKGMPKTKILEYIRNMEYVQFGSGAKAFLQNISLFSIGSEVRLNNGMVALVTGHTSIPERPIITFTSGPLKGISINLTDKRYLTYSVEEIK